MFIRVVGLFAKLTDTKSSEIVLLSDKKPLLENIRQVFRDRGYDGATLAHLAKATGLSKATLYHHFPGGKQDMLGQLIRLSIADLNKHAFAHLNQNTDAHARLHAFIEGFAHYIEINNGNCLLATMVMHQASQSDLDRHQQDIANQFQDWQQQLERVFNEAGNSNKRSRRMAGELLSQLYGGVTVNKLLDQPPNEGIFAQIIKRQSKTYR